MSAESGTWDAAGWYFSASHSDPVRTELHGHSYEVVAWWPTGQDSVELQDRLKAVLKAYDHKTLPDELSRGHDLAKAIGMSLKGCVGVDILRPVERIGARWRL